MKLKIELDTGELGEQAAAKLRAGTAAVKRAGQEAGRAAGVAFYAMSIIFVIGIFVAYWFGAAFIFREAMDERDPASRLAMFIGGGVACLLLTVVAIKVMRRLYSKAKTPSVE